MCHPGRLYLQVEGKGASPKLGQTVTIDWDGYTIGYYGRPFEARNKVCAVPLLNPLVRSRRLA